MWNVWSNRVQHELSSRTKIINSTVTGEGYVGGLVGNCNGNVLIENCSFSGEVVSSSRAAGGICGTIGGTTGSITINHCSFEGSVIDNYEDSVIYGAGGIVGHVTFYSGNVINFTINITNCSNKGDIEGYASAGGIIGRYGSGSGNRNYTNNLYVSNCYNTGNILARLDSTTYNASGVGGIVGTVAASYLGTKIINNCYNIGSISTNFIDAGGIAGRLTAISTAGESFITNCFNAGSVSGSTSTTFGFELGGIVGGMDSHSTVSYCKWGVDCTLSSAAGSGTVSNCSTMTETQAKTQSWYTTSSNWNSSYPWDFEETWTIISSQNNGYPVLLNTDVEIYNIYYNANGGSGSMASQTKISGVDLTLRSNTFTRTGYTFQGWATSASGSVVYANGATYTANASVTLYAVWADTTNPTISRVTYTQNDGTSYYVYAYASDSGSGINRVQFPTWTNYEW